MLEFSRIVERKRSTHHVFMETKNLTVHLFILIHVIYRINNKLYVTERSILGTVTQEPYIMK